MLRGKSTAAQAFLKMKKNLKLTAQPKKLEQEPTKSTVSRRKAVIKIREEVNNRDSKNNRKNQ